MVDFMDMTAGSFNSKSLMEYLLKIFNLITFAPVDSGGRLNIVSVLLFSFRQSFGMVPQASYFSFISPSSAAISLPMDLEPITLPDALVDLLESPRTVKSSDLEPVTLPDALVDLIALPLDSRFVLNSLNL